MSQINPVGGARPLPQRNVVAQATAPVTTQNANAAADEKPDPVGGIAGKAFEALKKVGGDLNQFRKEHPVLAILVAVAGAFTGWKLDELAHRAKERSEGNNFNQNGQNAYLKFKDEGSLLKAVGDEHTFFDNVKSWPASIFPNEWTDAKKWQVFCAYTVQAEIARPTIGDIDGKANMPTVLTAFAKNKTADKDALTALAAGIRTQINGAPAKQGFYQPVIDALKATHGISV
jgi:hypothetical protein